MTTEHSPFPSDQTLAAFIDGKLDERTRERVLEHMTRCAECRDVVLDTSELKAEGVLPADSEIRLPAPVVPIRRKREAWAGLAAAAAVAVVVLLVWPRDPITKLARVAPPERYNEGRLVGFKYAKPAPNMRGEEKEEPATKPEYLPFDEAYIDVEKKAADHPSAHTLHAKGDGLLVLGKPDEALKAFGRALQYETHQSDIGAAVQASKDWRLLSDLAAAYIASGRYAEALTAAERAWRLSKSPEAAWNRAMAAHQWFEHRNQAIGYWHDYLQIDSDSQWASEAREKLQALQTP